MNTNANPKYEKLKNLLKELFQLDQPDLDFGIYRIMHARSQEITKFLDKDLLPQVKEAFAQYQSADKKEIQKQLDEAITQAKNLGVDPETTTKVKELRAQLAGAAVDTDALESEVYDHLYSFFRRYYSEGDFISKRVYKEGVYAIPYEGEEVKLYWANYDQYYIKTSEYLRDYAFRLNPGNENNPLRVHFRLVDAAEGEHNNVKEAEGKARVFVLASENFIGVENGELVIKFEFRPAVLTDWPEAERTGKTKPPTQKELIAIAEKRILAVQDARLNPWLTELQKKQIKADGTAADYSRLVAHLNRYTARNTFDYFIHKDLGGFLNRELDFYIKNEVMHLDDIENESAPRVEQYLSKIKVIRTVAKKIIDFLAQLENFQKKLWLKKKFVVETNYCITLDRVPEEFYPEIASNQAQIQEWVKLFAIDEIKPTAGDLLNAGKPGYTVPLTVEFLKAHNKLVLDTRFFREDFKAKLIASIDNFDEQMDGLLIHSENFQALNLLQARYREQVKCVYIDPPYNTEQDRNEGKFLYKDNYHHSSWITFMYDRTKLAYLLQAKDSAIYISINEDELYNLNKLLIEIYKLEMYLSTFVVKVRHENRILKGDKDFHEVYENVLAYRKTYEHCPTKREEENTSFDEYEWEIIVKGEPIETINIDGKKIEIFSSNSYEIKKVNPFMKGLKRISVRGTLREGNSSGRFYVKNIEPIKEKYANNLIKVYGIGDDGLGYRYFWCPSVESGRKNGDYFQGVPQNRKDIRLVPFANFWDFEKEFNNSSNEGGVEFRNAKKPLKFLTYILTLQNAIEYKNCIVLDYFAGSGTTGHAVINLNREDGGKRKYILVEMGDYFDTVLKPRIQKVIYSADWKDGKPVPSQNSASSASLRETDSSYNGISHCFKYIRLESYEDTLNNLDLRHTEQQANILDFSGEGAKSFKEDYILHYMLDVESRGSASLLNTEAFMAPTAYKLKVKIPGSDESRIVTVDLIETFNYLLGLQVEHIASPQRLNADFERDSEKRLRIKGRLIELSSASSRETSSSWHFRTVTGTTLDGRKILVIWRNRPGGESPEGVERDNLVLDEWFKKMGYSSKDREFDIIYVNGTNNLENLKTPDDQWKVRLIEEDFKRLMFEETGV
ncbi:MAG: DNA methyltransferase [Spirochaetota bacterium]